MRAVPLQARTRLPKGAVIQGFEGDMTPEQVRGYLWTRNGRPRASAMLYSLKGIEGRMVVTGIPTVYANNGEGYEGEFTEVEHEVAARVSAERESIAERTEREYEGN